MLLKLKKTINNKFLNKTTKVKSSMSKIINIQKDFYEEDCIITNAETIKFETGLTILVGCNGAGKTTLLKNIESQLKRENVPYFSYDNLNDGGKDAKSLNFFSEEYEKLYIKMCSSEGENILLNLGEQVERWKEFLVNAKTGNKFDSLFFSEEQQEAYKERKDSNERWFLLDAIDSGFSIDNVVDLKTMLNLLLKDGKELNKDVYIVVSANEFELAKNERCLDVINGEYMKFKDYDEYRDYILESKDEKIKRELEAQELKELQRQEEERKKEEELEEETYLDWRRRRDE